MPGRQRERCQLLPGQQSEGNVFRGRLWQAGKPSTGTRGRSYAAAYLGFVFRRQTAGKQDACLLQGIGRFLPQDILEQAVVAEHVCLTFSFFTEIEQSQSGKWKVICHQNGKCVFQVQKSIFV